ncbi:MAG TPA: helix-turn-helix domain-containing protein [Sandaracinaceae bacterium LLY-WYZ-13_1]|nr:helix-turn-helix domain-containing protein [Sandaracinaceae bacterium LLY-WYZ-13_1]
MAAEPTDESQKSPEEEVVLFREPGEGAEDEAPAAPKRPSRVVSVTGAKGGVGKSVVASNLAVYLASIGRRVVLVDADVGGANLHTILGVRRPLPGRRPPPVEETEEDDDGPTLLPTPVPGLSLYHAGLDEPPAGSTRKTRRAQLRERLGQLEADYVVVDLGAGTSSTLLDFHLAADLSLFVTLPEPTAIENTYRFIRHAFVRFLRRAVEDDATRRALVGKIRELGGAPPPLDLWRRLEDDGDPLADSVREWMESFAPSLVLNQTRLRADLELGDAMRTAARRRLGVAFELLGHIDYDDTVWSCVRNRRLLLVESPGSKSAKSIEKIARRLLAQKDGSRRRRERTVPPESHHDLLEVERGATDEDVRRAFKRAREIYAPQALCCYGLFEPDELETVRTRLEEAFDVLLDPARRRPYELSVFPIEEDEARDEPSSALPADLPPPPEITPDTDFSGPLIRQVRESQGVELRDISQTTKVGMPYLRAIEEDDYGALPAPVYVRGFVTEFAKYLRLDSAQVSRTYVKRYRRYLDERGEAP